MKHLSVPLLPLGRDRSLDDLSMRLDAMPRNSIGMVPWVAYDYKPEVSFSIGYTNQDVCLKYYVSEKFAKAIYANPNDPVHEDSCVEFFIAFRNEPEYYNFEFNCAGTCMLGFGKERAGRKILPEEVIRRIGYQSVLKPSGGHGANIGWQLTLRIPLDVFCYHRIETLKGERCRVNFFKCGDELPEPCFLSWNNITTQAPDFHTPQYFGSMEFV